MSNKTMAGLFMWSDVFFTVLAIVCLCMGQYLAAACFWFQSELHAIQRKQYLMMGDKE